MRWHCAGQPRPTLLNDDREMGRPCRRARNAERPVLVRRRQTLDDLVLHMQAFFLEFPELFISNVSG